MRLVLLSAILFILLTDVKAQVSIGLLGEPGKAALVDIKTRIPDTDGGPTAGMGDGGLLFSRVVLKSKDTLEPFIEKGSSGDDEYIRIKKRYTGMIVYNLATLTDLEPGICVWDGEKWNNIYETGGAVSYDSWLLEGNQLTGDGDSFIGTADAQKLSFRTNNQERIHITSDGNIGLLTNETPKATLEVNGETSINDTLYLGNLEKAPENVAQLVIDENNRVCKVVSSTGNIIGINELTYKFTNLLTGDWVGRFNTQIPTKDYTLVVVGYIFLVNTGYPTDGLVVGEIGKPHPGTYVPMDVVATGKNNLGVEYEHWLLRADNVGGNTYRRDGNYPSGTWMIFCHAINNSLVNILEELNIDLQGKAEGSAVQMPEGL